MFEILLFLEAAVVCALLSAIIIPRKKNDPASLIASYPPEIKKRLKKTPDYAREIRRRERELRTYKIYGVAIAGLAFGLIAYITGNRTFFDAFAHVFTVLSIVNMYDLFVFDIILFCNNPDIIILGTEDMEEEYRNPTYHIKSAIRGIGLLGVASVIAAFVARAIGNIFAQ